MVLQDTSYLQVNVLYLFFPEVTIGFSQTGYVVQESVGVASVSVRLLSGQLGEEVSVRLTSSDGTTSAGACIKCIIIKSHVCGWFKSFYICKSFCHVQVDDMPLML